MIQFPSAPIEAIHMINIHFSIYIGTAGVRLSIFLKIELHGVLELEQTRMWANAQPDGRPAEHRWRLLFNAAKFG